MVSSLTPSAMGAQNGPFCVQFITEGAPPREKNSCHSQLIAVTTRIGNPSSQCLNSPHGKVIHGPNWGPGNMAKVSHGQNWGSRMEY